MTVQTVSKPADDKTKGDDAKESKGKDAKSPIETTKATEVAPSVPLAGAVVTSVTDETPEQKAAREAKEFADLEAEEKAADAQLELAKKRRETAQRLADKRAEAAKLHAESASLEASAKATAPAAAPAQQQNPELASNLEQMRIELAKAEAIEKAANEAEAQAREDEKLKQAKFTDTIDYQLIEDAGKRAADKVRRKALNGRGAGIYIQSPLQVMGPDGPVILPKSSRMPDKIADNYPAADLEKLEADGIIQDLR